MPIQFEETTATIFTAIHEKAKTFSIRRRHDNLIQRRKELMLALEEKKKSAEEQKFAEPPKQEDIANAQQYRLSVPTAWAFTSKEQAVKGRVPVEITAQSEQKQEAPATMPTQLVDDQLTSHVQPVINSDTVPASASKVKITTQNDPVVAALKALKIFIETHKFETGVFGGEWVENNPRKVPKGMQLIHKKITEFLSENDPSLQQAHDCFETIKNIAASRTGRKFGFLFLGMRDKSTMFINKQLTQLKVNNLLNIQDMQNYLTVGIKNNQR